MSAAATEWVLLSRCPSIGHAELLLAALGKAGLGGEIRGRHLTAVQAAPVEVWVQSRKTSRVAGRAARCCRSTKCRLLRDGRLLCDGPVPPTAGLRGLDISRRIAVAGAFSRKPADS